MDVRAPFVMRGNVKLTHRGEELPANVYLFRYDKGSKCLYAFHSCYNEDKLVLWKLNTVLAGFNEKVLSVPYPGDDLLDYAAADNRMGQMLLFTSYFDFTPKCGRIRVWEFGDNAMNVVSSQPVNPLPSCIRFGPTKKWIFGMHTPRDTRAVYGFRAYTPGDDFPPFDKELTVRIFGENFKDVRKPRALVQGSGQKGREDGEVERDSDGSLPGDAGYGQPKPDVMKLVDCNEDVGILIRAKSDANLNTKSMDLWLFKSDQKEWVEIGKVEPQSQKYLLGDTAFLDTETNILYGIEKVKKDDDKYGEEPQMLKVVQLEYEQFGCPISNVKIIEDDYNRFHMERELLLVRDGILFCISNTEGSVGSRYIRLPTMKEEAQMKAQKMYGKATETGIVYEAFDNKKFRDKTGCKGANVFPNGKL